MLEYFDFLLPSSHICESLKSQFPPTQLSQALKDYHDKTHYAVMADFRNRYYFIWRDLLNILFSASSQKNYWFIFATAEIWHICLSVYKNYGQSFGCGGQDSIKSFSMNFGEYYLSIFEYWYCQLCNFAKKCFSRDASQLRSKRIFNLIWKFTIVNIFSTKSGNFLYIRANASGDVVYFKF